jgi:small subunit ribosomal protein S18
MINTKQKANAELPHVRYFDYKDVDTLKKFMNQHGRIISRKHTKLPAREQRELARAVKNARFMGIFPYIVK